MNCSESGIYGVPSQQNLYFTNYCVIPGEIAEKVSLSEKRMEASGLLYGVSENLEEDLKQVNEQLSAYDLDGMAAFFFSGRLRLFRREKGDGGRKRNIGGISVEWDDL